MAIELIFQQVRRDNFLAVCPNKVKGATTVNVTWNYSESAGSAVAAALEAEVNISKICDFYIYLLQGINFREIRLANVLKMFSFQFIDK